MTAEVDVIPKTEFPKHLETYWRAWRQLSASRAHIVVGMGAAMGAMMIRSVPQEIPFLAIQEWCDRVRMFNDEEREAVVFIVNVMDDTYREWWQEKNRD
jgi:hypothetical protein